MSSDYEAFLNRRRHGGAGEGFDPVFMPEAAFDFQRALIEWACRMGRCAIFADCGLGKTLIQLTWAENVVRKTGGRVLVLTPIAVGTQTIREGAKFGVEITRSQDGKIHSGITTTNYERLHYFDPSDFAGVVCDESSILKNYDGAIKGQVNEFLLKMPYRLLCTATAAPNDYTELGTSSEALGGLGHMDMLNRFFKNDLENSSTGRKYGEVVKWRFKGHAEEPFWRWVCSWARALRKPSDLGFSDSAFTLPKLSQSEHVVSATMLRAGYLIPLPAVGLAEQREEARRTVKERCEKVAELVAHKRPALVWCHLNPEGDLLEKLIPDCVQVSGKDSDEAKEEKLLAFQSGKARVLVTKPKIGAWGLNFQHCNHVVFFPSHSFEQFYQGVRRCWRFGQKKPVHVDVVATEGGCGVLANLTRKAAQSEKMFEQLVTLMNQQLAVSAAPYGKLEASVPSWL